MNWLRPLRYLNSIPFPVVQKYYVALGVGAEQLRGTLRGGEDWFVLRNKSSRYRIAQTREEWLKDLSTLDDSIDGLDAALPERVESLARLIERAGIKTLFSVGSGGCYFEYHLKRRLPALKVVVTEPVPELVGHLKELFIEADSIEQFDALDARSWERVADMPACLVFIYRNEREFSDEEWRTMFGHMDAAGVERVFLGLMWTLTVLAFVFRKWNNLKARFRGRRVSFVGYIRNFRGLERLWQRHYVVAEEITFPACRGLYLKRIHTV